MLTFLDNLSFMTKKFVSIIENAYSFLFHYKHFRSGIKIPFGSCIGPLVVIGRGTNINKSSDIRGLVKIGRYCAIAGNLTIISSNHATDTIVMQSKLSRLIGGKKVHGKFTQNVIIGDGVWIGINVTILPNVTIGEGAILGAGSVVTKSVPPYSIVAGNPAKLTRERIPSNLINDVLELNLFKLDLESLSSISGLRHFCSCSRSANCTRAPCVFNASR